MSDAIANCTLELACTVGSIENAREALEDGADIDAGGGSPLFNAIFHRNVEMVRFLIGSGADLSAIIPASKLAALSGQEAIIGLLMECAPPDPREIDPGLMGEMDATIRNSGLGKPVLEGDWDGMVFYAEKLERIGAPELCVCVTEVIDMLKPAKSFGDAALFETVKAEKKKIVAITERYAAVAGDSVEILAREFLDAGDTEAVEGGEEKVEGELDADSGAEDVAAVAV